jgi:hypothetical protein
MELITETFCVPNTSIGCGNGICNLRGDFCQCNDGFVHDFTQMLFPNCFLAESTRLAMLISISILCGIIGAYGAYLATRRRSFARWMCLIVLANSGVEILHLISLGLEGKPGIATMLFLALLDTIGGCIAPFCLLWALCAPAVDLTLQLEKKRLIELRIKGCIVLFAVIQVALFSPALAYQYAGNFRMFNTIFASVLAYVAVYAIIWTIAIRYFSVLLFKRMDEVLANLDAKHKSDQLVMHRKRLGL